MAYRQRGITLIELITTCALLALLAGIALPGAARWVADVRAESTLQRINAGLSYARLIAVTENTPVVLCPLDATNRCRGDWSGGFVAFRDPKRRARRPASEPLLRQFPASDARVVLRAFRSRNYFRFLPNGQTDWQNGRFIICPVTAGVAVRSLVINVQGRVRTERPQAGHPAC